MKVLELVPQFSQDMDSELTQLDRLLVMTTSSFKRCVRTCSDAPPTATQDVIRPPLKSFCGCSCSNDYPAGVTKKPSTSSVIIWCCDSSVGSISNGFLLTRLYSAGHA